MARCSNCASDSTIGTTGRRDLLGNHTDRDQCLLESAALDNLATSAALSGLGSAALLSGNISGIYGFLHALTVRVRALEPA